MTLPLALLEVGSQIINKLIPDPEAKAKAQLGLLTLQQNGELKELETRMSAITAEANSSDPWTSRARPSFMYVTYIVIICLTILAPILGVFFPTEMGLFFGNVKAGFAAIPDVMWDTFLYGFLGYSAARSAEKIKGVAK